jgi:2-octaprenyl-6-methoxyphenol hydroxylase
MTISSDTPYDVVISGGGMNGLTLSLALESAGLRCVLIEKDRPENLLDVSYDGRASAIASACFRQWEALGLGPRLRPHCGLMTEIVVTDTSLPGANTKYSGSPFILHFWAQAGRERARFTEANEPLGYLIENRQIRAALYESLSKTAVSIITHSAIKSVTNTSGFSEIIVNTGQTLKARLVVAAEGRNSPLRNKANIGVTRWSYGQSALVLTVALSRPHNQVAYEHFLPNGPFAVLPMTQNRACIVWTETNERARALIMAPGDTLKSHLVRRMGNFLGEIDILGNAFCYPLDMMLAHEMISDRLALVGDSAHSIHPIAGQGLNLGLKDVAALAQVLSEAHQRGEDIGSSLVLDRYSRWRRFDTVSTTLATDGFVRLFSNNDPLMRLGRGLGMGLVNVSKPMRDWFIKTAGADGGDQPRLLQGIRLMA